ncbi:betaine/proline/choline family ABC transporter ATP-binding protein [Aquibacillus sediminis]|uniref:betaine/proline/choline family ABC transporter ATP-binding protein n=1 Tax=Aquibacillus sediminis TaxID=2574734 RepID=UPI001107D2A7|nr:betaine/proline/choline family ABC transporter ATP-binding protein [Aquibacillus sediminis]
MIQLKRINKVYDDGFQALKEIDLTFEEGKINVLIGPSGCGKTTTMKLLNRLTEYTDGQILIDGKDLNQINPIELRRQMGYVIQNIGLFPHMTIYDNVATVPKLLKWDKQRIRKRVDELLQLVNLDPETYRGRYPSELSGGQQQRIGVIRALAAEPSTILMDEPFSALDPISREQLQDELVRLQREINKTIVFVTHDMDEAIKIADQVILMKDGQVVQKGSPKQLLENPANEFVREFIGENRLESAKTLPPLSEFVVEGYPSVTGQSDLQDVIDVMVEHNLAELPVVDGENKYRGIVSLYRALSNKQAVLSDVLDTSIQAVNENEAIDDVMNHTKNAPGSVIPIVSNESELIGVVNHNQLFQALHQFYQRKSGGE